MTKQEFLAAELTKHIAHFNSDSTRHKIMYRGLRYVAFIFSATSTILAGIALAYPELQTGLNISILFASAAIGVASSIEGLRRPQELWVHERSVLYELRDVERDLQYRSQDEVSALQIDELYGRMQSILQSSREKWRQSVAKPKSENDQSIQQPEGGH